MSPEKDRSKSGPTSAPGLAMNPSSNVETPVSTFPTFLPLSPCRREGNSRGPGCFGGGLVGQLLQGPAVPVGIFEGRVKHPAEILYLAHLNPPA